MFFNVTIKTIIIVIIIAQKTTDETIKECILKKVKQNTTLRITNIISKKEYLVSLELTMNSPTVTAVQR